MQAHRGLLFYTYLWDTSSQVNKQRSWYVLRQTICLGFLKGMLRRQTSRAWSLHCEKEGPSMANSRGHLIELVEGEISCNSLPWTSRVIPLIIIHGYTIGRSAQNKINSLFLYNFIWFSLRKLPESFSLLFLASPLEELQLHKVHKFSILTFYIIIFNFLKGMVVKNSNINFHYYLVTAD